MSKSEDRSVFELVGRAPDLVLSYGEKSDQVIDLYAGINKKLPLLIVIHGGYWRHEYDRVHLRPFAAALADLGWQVALIEYQRIAGQPYLMSNDVSSAIKFSLAEVAGHNGSAILIGHSAGGQLAMWAASVITGFKSVIALAPVPDLRSGEALNLDEGAIQSFLGAKASECSDLDPIRISTQGNPITIIHGDSDIWAPLELTENYVQQKLSEKERINLIKLPDIGHFELIDPRHAVWEILQSELNKFKN
jgi:acetyl esterase/lipase